MKARLWALINAGRLAEARSLAADGLSRSPGDPDLLLAAGIVEAKDGRHRQALKLLDQARERKPGAAVWNAIAIARKGMGDLDGAAWAYAQALERDSGNPDLLFNLARLHMDRGEAETASALLDQALAVRPAHPPTLKNLGVCHRRRGQPAKAADCFSRAAELVPADPLLWSHLGSAALKAGQIERARQAHGRALAIAPDHPEVLNNLGELRFAENRRDQAVAAYRAALKARPEYAEARHGLGAALLAEGNFAEGWKEWEWRLGRADFSGRRPIAPLWLGEPMDGTLLVHSEGGLGDSINFLPWVVRAAERCSRVVFACQGALVPLLAGQAGPVEVVDQDQPLPPADAFAYVMSLPGLFVHARSDMDGRPFLTAPAGPVPAPGDGRKRVGLAWTEQTGDLLGALEGLDHLDFVSLQEPTGDFAEAAAVIAGLDLVVAVDAPLAHLAGALGKPVWILLQAGADWRWFQGEDSPWYGSARLIRQAEAGDWGPVLARLRRELAEI